jgi:hypothetical protein
MKRAVASITSGSRRLNSRRGPWGWFYPRFCGLLAAVRDKLAEMRADAPSVGQGFLS